MIKGLLFDYGGTIDTNGLHWAVVLYNSYEKHGIILPREVFYKAYTFGEKSLAIHPIVFPSFTFLEVLQAKVGQQFAYLNEQGYRLSPVLAPLIAADCNDFAAQTVARAKPVLGKLAESYPLVMVSNFYGNLNTVLETFGIRHLFKAVVESAVVGVRKPDPAIYKLGVEQLGFLPEECLVIGDSFSKDIIPAKTVGCAALWLNGTGWEDEGQDLKNQEQDLAADQEINDFKAIPEYLANA